MTTKQLTVPHEACAEDGQAIVIAIPNTPQSLRTQHRSLRVMIPQSFYWSENGTGKPAPLLDRMIKGNRMLLYRQRRTAGEGAERNRRLGFVETGDERMLNKLKV